MTTPVQKRPSPRGGFRALPRPVRIIVALVAVGIGLYQFRTGLFELFPSLGADAQVKAAAEKATAAAKSFLALTKDVYRTANPPRQTDASAGPLLDAVFNVGILQTKPTLAKADLQGLADWGTSTIRTGSVYVLAGTGIADPTKATNDPKLIQITDRNTAAYAPEIGRYLDADLVIMGAMAGVVAENFKNGPGDKPNVTEAEQKFRAGFATTIDGAIRTFAVDGIKDDWRRDRLTALDSIAPKATKVLAPEQCSNLRATAHTVEGIMGDAAVKNGLATFAAELKC